MGTTVPVHSATVTNMTHFAGRVFSDLRDPEQRKTPIAVTILTLAAYAAEQKQRRSAIETRLAELDQLIAAPTDAIAASQQR
ncbi:MAG: hypothetical protein U0936_02715 [Planctomycetaceae bacterium]